MLLIDTVKGAVSVKARKFMTLVAVLGATLAVSTGCIFLPALAAGESEPSTDPDPSQDVEISELDPFPSDPFASEPSSEPDTEDPDD